MSAGTTATRPGSRARLSDDGACRPLPGPSDPSAICAWRRLPGYDTRIGQRSIPSGGAGCNCDSRDAERSAAERSLEEHSEAEVDEVISRGDDGTGHGGHEAVRSGLTCAPRGTWAARRSPPGPRDPTSCATAHSHLRGVAGDRVHRLLHAAAAAPLCCGNAWMCRDRGPVQGHLVRAVEPCPLAHGLTLRSRRQRAPGT